MTIIDLVPNERKALARAGDTGVTVRMDALAWHTAYPAGTPELMVTAPGGVRWPVTVAYADGKISGEVPDELMVRPGLYSYTFAWINAGEQVRSSPCGAIILAGETSKKWNPHSKAPDWADRIFLAAEAIEKAAKDYVTPEMFGAICDGVDDDAIAINAAVAYAIENNIYKVKLLPKTYTIKTTINISDNVVFGGVNAKAWNYGGGTILAAAEGITAISVSHSYAKLSNFKIVGNNTSIGITYVNNSYGCSTENVVISACTTGFDIQKSWSYIFKHCRTENCETGFNIAEGTNANFISCLAFGSTGYGFYCTKLNYGVLSGCGTDGCKYGYYFQGACRGVTLVSCGSEHTTENGYMIYCGSGTAVTITAFSVGVVKDVQCDVFVLRDGSNTTLIDTNVGSAYYPLGNTIDVSSDAHTVLINCMLAGTKTGYDYCETFGKTNQMKFGLKVPSIQSIQKTTESLNNNASEEIAQLDTESFYIFSAVCTSASNSRGFGFISIPSTYTEAVIDVSTETASAVASISETGMLSITNKSSYAKAYKVTLLKIA